MILKRFKKYTERLLEPLSKTLSRRGVNPNHITVAGAAVSFLSGIFYYKGSHLLGAVLLIIAGLCDLLDGNIARVNQKVSPFGAFLDSTVDRYSDMFVLFGILGFAFKNQDASLFWITILALMGSFMVSYTRARAECIIERCDVGIMERPERMVVLIAASILGVLEAGLLVIAVFANITAIQRIHYTYRQTKRLEEKRDV